MENQNQNQIEPNLGMNEIEYKQVFKFISRNSKTLSYIIFAGFLISTFNAITRKEIWQGQFQIVLEDKNTSSISRLSEIANQIPSLSNVSTSATKRLKTEVEILKSPSILMSIFNFVEEKKKNTKGSYKKVSFKRWLRDYVDVKLTKGTSVLTLSYRDHNKNLIIPVLEKISNEYQLYSRTKNQSKITSGLNYLEKQINIYRKKSKDTLEKAQKFSIDNDLPFTSSKMSSGPIGAATPGANFNEPTKGRIRASDEIRVLDEQIIKLKDLNDPSKILYFAKNNLSSLPIFDANMSKDPSDPPKGQLVKTIENDLVLLSKLQNIYNEDSNRIKDLKKLIDRNSFVLKNLTLESLRSQRMLAKSRKAASERPEGVIIKHQNLWLEAHKDYSLLNDLEAEYMLLNLDKAEAKAPWKLITQPTLFEKRVAPKRSKIVLLWTTYFTLAAFLITYFLEGIKNKIHNSKELEKLITFNLIDTLNYKEKESWGENIQIFAESKLFKNSPDKIGIIGIGENKNDSINIISSLLKSYLNENQIYICENLTQIKETEAQILIFETNTIERSELAKFLTRLNNQDLNIMGWFLIEK